MLAQVDPVTQGLEALNTQVLEALPIQAPAVLGIQVLVGQHTMGREVLSIVAQVDRLMTVQEDLGIQAPVARLMMALVGHATQVLVDPVTRGQGEVVAAPVPVDRH